MVKSKMVDLWFKKAERDLRFSKAVLTPEEQFFDEIVFHWQRSAEEFSKVFLIEAKECQWIAPNL